MKPLFFILPAVFLTAFLTGCLLEPVSDNPGGQSSSVSSTTSSGASSSSSSSTGIIPATINVQVYGVAKGIDIYMSTTTQADIIITNPSGSYEKQQWFTGGTNIFTFLSYESGSHSITVIENGISNYCCTNNAVFSLSTGYEYYIGITLGGNVIVSVGTNH